MTQWIPESMTNQMSPEQKGTWMMRAFGFSKVPLLFLASPKILQLNSTLCKVEIPFRKIVKNHLGSLYFGALAIGADTCVGMLAMHKIKSENKNISLVFKDFNIQFLKRSEGPTQFICESGAEIQKMVDETISTGERVSVPIPGYATCNGVTTAEFTLTLSLKYKPA